MNCQTECAAFVGIDWADQHHDYCLLDPASDERHQGRFEHTPEALLQWVEELHQRSGGRPVAICLEQSRGPLIYALMRYEFLILYPINPKTLAKYREAFSPSGAKDDPTDAALLCELVAQHRDRLSAWRPDDEKTRQLSGFCEQRRKAVDLRTRLVLQQTATLKSYFPQAIEWVGRDLATAMACDFVLKWPTLDTVRRAKPQTVRSFYYGHNCRREPLIQERLDQISHATALTSDPAILEPLVLVAQTLARLIRDLHTSIEQFDQRITAVFKEHPDGEIFDSFPGAGAQLAPRLLCAFGTDRSRYPTPSQMQSFSGMAPVLERSGKQAWVHWRWARPVFLSQTFYEFAQKSITFSAWADAYYRMQRAQGKGAHASIRALAFKWIRVLFRCWQDRTRYDETRYLAVLKSHGSPILEYLQQNEPA